MTEYYVTVDPGLGGTGLSFWDVPSWREKVCPIRVVLIQASGSSNGRKLNWIERSNLIANDFDFWIAGTVPKKVWIELPGLHQNAAGMASASSGDIFKLAILVGMFSEICRRAYSEMIPLPVNTWKGQLPKEQVAQRVCEALKCDEKKYGNHVMDSVGMGLYLKGFINQSRLSGGKEVSKSSEYD